MIPSKKVHYAVTDAAPGFTVPNANWTNSLFWGSGGDQTFVAQQVCGPVVTFTGNKAAATYINIGDQDWTFWNTQPRIDILVQAYGDETLMINTDGHQHPRVAVPVAEFGRVSMRDERHHPKQDGQWCGGDHEQPPQLQMELAAVLDYE